MAFQPQEEELFNRDSKLTHPLLDVRVKRAVRHYLAHHQRLHPSVAAAVVVAIIIGRNPGIRAARIRELIARDDSLASTTSLAKMASSRLHPLRATPHL
jgi:hypothetical protein